MKEMIKNYRGTLISSALVILAGILVGFTSIQGKWLNVYPYEKYSIGDIILQAFPK